MGFATVNFDLEELVGAAGTPSGGHVRFEPGATYVPDVDGQPTAVRPFIVEFDGDGLISQQVLAGIPWTVKFSVHPTYIAPVSFTAEEGDVLDLATITETTAETVAVTVLYNASMKADKSALDAETAARAAADDAFDTALEAETDAREAADAALQAALAALPETYVALNEQIAINGGFTNSYDTDLWIAGATRTNPVVNSQGIYVQHRVAGDLGALVHDAAATELRLSGVSNTGVGQSAHESSVVVTGGSNTINLLCGVLANFHTSGTPTGTATEVSLVRATAIPALAAGFTIGTVKGIHVDQQTVGTTNYSIYAPDGNSVFGPLVPKDVATNAVKARGLAGQTAPVVQVDDSAAAKKFAVSAAGVVDAFGTAALIRIRNAGDTGTFVQMGPNGFRWNDSGLQQTTVGAAGGASALPATPTKYLKVQDSAGTTLVIPAYAAT